MIDTERAKKHFINHVATFTDYGNIKILDFQNPGHCEYRIRFLFEEDHYRLHISGDLGELTAFNFINMRYDTFSDFTDNPWYFEDKIQCHSRDLYVYDKDAAREELKNAVKNRNGNLMKVGARREKKLLKKKSMIFFMTLTIEEG